jgi:hypothetical protein
LAIKEKKIPIMISIIILSPFILLIYMAGNGSAQDDMGTYIYLIDSEPFDIPYNQWTESWWNWLVSIPKATNPALDTDGKYCQEGLQPNYPVFFLVGSLDETADRSCTIPSNMSLFFPATSSFCYNTASTEITEEELRTCASFQKSDPGTNVVIDGINLNTFAYDIKNARVQSNLFNISVPSDSILDISPQNVSGIAAGNWVFLKPGALQSGNHEISITGKLNGTSSDVSYSLDVTDS